MPMRTLRLALFAVLANASGTLVAADGAALEGRWVALDGDTHKPRAVIEIVREGRRAIGRITELHVGPGEDPDPVCTNCPGDFKGKRIRGLAILSLAVESETRRYRGTVLDPEEGRLYDCVATLVPDGRQLRLRGYVGIELFGREETWLRHE